MRGMDGGPVRSGASPSSPQPWMRTTSADWLSSSLTVTPSSQGAAGLRSSSWSSGPLTPSPPSTRSRLRDAHLAIHRVRAAGLVPATPLHEFCDWMALRRLPQGNTAMTTKTDLLPLPPLYIVPSVEPVDYPDVAQALKIGRAHV